MTPLVLLPLAAGFLGWLLCTLADLRRRRRRVLRLLRDHGPFSGPGLRHALGGSFSVYVVLHALEDEGLVASDQAPLASPGVRRYRLTPAGARAIMETKVTRG